MVDVSGFETLVSAIETHETGADLVTLLQAHRHLDNHFPKSSWYVPILISIVITPSLGLAIRISYPYCAAGVNKFRKHRLPQISMDTPTQDTHPSPTATEPLTGDEGARE
jgi:hypothetical protein